jgi:hypothetical protein
VRLYSVIFAGIRDQSTIIRLDVSLQRGLVGPGHVTAVDYHYGPGRRPAGHPHGVPAAAGDFVAAAVIFIFAAITERVICMSIQLVGMDSILFFLNQTGFTGLSGLIFVFINFRKKLMKSNPPLVERIASRLQ